jgi:aminoglycoside 6'-N-acetyltransferase
MSDLPRVIATRRLRLRPWRLDDVDAVLRYATSQGWAEYLPVPQPYTRAHAEEFVATQRLRDWRHTAGWAVCIEGDVPDGGIDLGRENAYRASLGYSVASTRWGHGYVAEAAAAVIDAAFESWPELHRVYAFTDARNARSRRVLEKLGMRDEGLLRAHHCHRGVLVDAVYYGILRPEWQTRRGAALAATAGDGGRGARPLHKD